MFFNFYKKGNVVKVFEILNREIYPSSYVPENFLPKGFGSYEAFIIGELFEPDYERKPNIFINKYREVKIDGYSRSVDEFRNEGFYGEIFIGEYFTN